MTLQHETAPLGESTAAVTSIGTSEASVTAPLKIVIPVEGGDLNRPDAHSPIFFGNDSSVMTEITNTTDDNDDIGCRRLAVTGAAHRRITVVTALATAAAY